MALHIDCTGSVHVALPPLDALRLFTPEGERRWIPNWVPEYLHPADGALAPGLQFRTRHHGPETIWIVTEYDETHLRAGYVRVIPGASIAAVSIACRAGAPGETDVEVGYGVTALDAREDAPIQGFKAQFPFIMKAWEQWIEQALAAL